MVTIKVTEFWWEKKKKKKMTTDILQILDFLLRNEFWYTGMHSPRDLEFWIEINEY